MSRLQHTLMHFTQRLEAANVDSPRLSAELVLAAALRVPRETLLRMRVLEPKTVLEAAVLGRAETLLARRENGEPMAYILGCKEFYGREFCVTPDTLIPRPETELLIDTALEYARGCGGAGCFADLGTGSGCIAVTLALELHGWSGVAVDKSPGALGAAENNAVALGTVNLDFLLGDFTACLFAPSSMDIIASNPPYISEAEYAGLSLEVRGFEPKNALVPGESGLEHMGCLLEHAAVALKQGGLLLIEIGAGQREAILDLATRHSSRWFFADVLPDLAGLPRLFTARKS